MVDKAKMNYQNYIKTELLILVPVLYLIGIGLKKSKLADKFIPLVIGGIAIFLALLWVFSTSEISSASEVLTALFTAITQGVLTAGTSVYANQLYIQSGKEE